jgi:hypothetical protein
MTMERRAGGYLERPAPSGLADVVEVILDKGIVIDAYARVAVLGVELLTFDARVVVSSVDTYLRFAEATNRLDVSDEGGASLVDLTAQGAGAAVEKTTRTVVERKVDGALDKVGERFGPSAENVARSAAGKIVDVAEDVAAKTLDGAKDPEQT